MSAQIFNNTLSNDSNKTYSFQEELEFLLQDNRMRVLGSLELRHHLKAVFHFEQAESTPFDLFFLKPKKVLFEFFDEILGTALHLPKGPIALKTYLKLCSQNISIDFLKAALKSHLFDDLDSKRLDELPLQHVNNMKAIISFSEQSKNQLVTVDWLLGIDLVSLMLPKDIQFETANHLAKFINKIFPYFIDRFSSDSAKAELLNHPSKILTWFLTWRSHYLKDIDELSSDHAYFEKDFKTVVQFIPLHLWWNNGMPYKDNQKEYTFNSEQFIHLALGGSIRNAPDFRPYTRRMAKEFVKLPYDFNPMGMDLYIYFYSKSLSSNQELNYLLQDFIKHHHYGAKVQEELDNWNPVIQKLDCKDFEDLVEDDKKSLLGYLSHGLKDIKNFSVRKRSIAQLLRATRDYEQRIQERAQSRAEKQRSRKAVYTSTWPAHKSIKPFEYTWNDKKFKIIELCSEGELNKEGAAMRHCVGTYSNRCKSGFASIWSLRHWKNNRWMSLVTIEISRKRIVQASGRFNSRPDIDHAELIRMWVIQEKLNQ